MDFVFLFFALLWIGYALWCGLHAIAAAIGQRNIYVRFDGPIDLVHRAQDETPQKD